jgi:uncharacterized protein (TIGR02266 family)
MAGDGHGDRRSHPRFAARIKVRFRSVEELVTAYSGDLSQGGLFVTSAQQLPPGSRVQLSLDLPDGQPPALIPARVKYALDAAAARAQGKQPGMGMEFLEEHTAPLGERIARFLDRTVEAEAGQTAAPIHVLVVDDSATYRSALERALSGAGHRVTTAEHGLAALGLAMKAPPDLVLSDVTMPVMDGWKLLRQLRSRPATAGVPVVFLTTLDSERDRIRGYELGVDDYIAKPFVTEELLARVQRVVARARREGPAGGEATGLSGELRQVSLPSLLAFAEAERRSGLLVLRGPEGEARVGLSGGAVVSVEGADVDPGAPLLERLLPLLDRTSGRFDLRDAEPPGEDERVSVQQALLEHARRVDEAG